MYSVVVDAAVMFMFDLVDIPVLYATSITVTWAPGDVTSYVEFIKNLSMSAAILFPVKAVCAFPLVYHYINGIRHLVYIPVANTAVVCITSCINLHLFVQYMLHTTLI